MKLGFMSSEQTPSMDDRCEGIGEIVVYRQQGRTDDKGFLRYDFEWQGGDIALIGWGFFTDGAILSGAGWDGDAYNTFSVGPFQVVPIGADRRGLIVQRVDA